MLPLVMAQVGEESTILKISGQDKIRQHLAELGFVVGEKVTVISRLGGNILTFAAKMSKKYPQP